MKIKSEKDGLIGIRTQLNEKNEFINLFTFDSIARKLNICCQNGGN